MSYPPSDRTLNRRALLHYAVAALLAGFVGGTRAQNAPQPPLATTEIRAGMHRIVAEVAAEPGTRSTGLMFRKALAPNHGMLFVFPERAEHCFWMRNTLIPLSIAFIEDDGRIANIADMAPRTEQPHCARRPVRFALEMDQGWFAQRGIVGGDRLGHADYFGAAAR